MSCECINTAVIMENENERLRCKIRVLEKKVKNYQKELFYLYSSGSESGSVDDSIISNWNKSSQSRSIYKSSSPSNRCSKNFHI